MISWALFWTGGTRTERQIDLEYNGLPQKKLLLMNFLEFVRSSDCWDGRGGERQSEARIGKKCWRGWGMQGAWEWARQGRGWEHTWADTFLRKDSITGWLQWEINERERAKSTCRAILKSDKLRVNKFGPKIFFDFWLNKIFSWALKWTIVRC